MNCEIVCTGPTMARHFLPGGTFDRAFRADLAQRAPARPLQALAGALLDHVTAFIWKLPDHKQTRDDAVIVRKELVSAFVTDFGEYLASDHPGVRVITCRPEEGFCAYFVENSSEHFVENSSEHFVDPGPQSGPQSFPRHCLAFFTRSLREVDALYEAVFRDLISRDVGPEVDLATFCFTGRELPALSRAIQADYPDLAAANFPLLARVLRSRDYEIGEKRLDLGCRYSFEARSDPAVRISIVEKFRSLRSLD